MEDTYASGGRDSLEGKEREGTSSSQVPERTSTRSRRAEVSHNPGALHHLPFVFNAEKPV